MTEVLEIRSHFFQERYREFSQTCERKKSDFSKEKKLWERFYIYALRLKRFYFKPEEVYFTDWQPIFWKYLSYFSNFWKCGRIFLTCAQTNKSLTKFSRKTWLFHEFKDFTWNLDSSQHVNKNSLYLCLLNSKLDLFGISKHPNMLCYHADDVIEMKKSRSRTRGNHFGYKSKLIGFLRQEFRIIF